MFHFGTNFAYPPTKIIFIFSIFFLLFGIVAHHIIVCNLRWNESSIFVQYNSIVHCQIMDSVHTFHFFRGLSTALLKTVPAVACVEPVFLPIPNVRTRKSFRFAAFSFSFAFTLFTSLRPGCLLPIVL